MRSAILATALLVTACTTAAPPERIVAMQQEIWRECRSELRPVDDWTPSCDGDCRHKALYAQEVLSREGWLVMIRTGCRSDKRGYVVNGQCNPARMATRGQTPLHMVAVACKDGACWAIDEDRAWPADSYPMVDHPYGWRVAGLGVEQ